MSLTSGDPAITEYIVATGILTGPHFLWDTLMDQLIFLNLVSITSIKYYISRRMYLHFYKRFFSLDEGIIVGISDMVADQSEAFFFFFTGVEKRPPCALPIRHHDWLPFPDKGSVPASKG